MVAADTCDESNALLAAPVSNGTIVYREGMARQAPMARLCLCQTAHRLATFAPLTGRSSNHVARREAGRRFGRAERVGHPARRDSRPRERQFPHPELHRSFWKDSL